ncbi:MAG: type II 3-dehydroquinate dehydratase [Bacteroidales bacterium]|jgi:3-dehydroquinate dehydratase-2|nr:type II 3-dehydroquinate dehydratase [Bacteroidales bacterium]MDY0053289.1 type II 3-dehydroquinate dehydratase [Bacteroidales bacterium]
MRIIIINGPNLNLLGKRQKDIYGDISFEYYLQTLRDEFPDIELEYFQSNIEGEIIDKLHLVGFSYDGIILNAGGYTHSSVSIADAVSSINTPVVEVHISNILAREEFRHVSLISPNAKGSIFGFGLKGYKLAIQAFL